MAVVDDEAPVRDALRRLYSTFAGSWPGLGLLLMRAVVGSVLLFGTGPKL